MNEIAKIAGKIETKLSKLESDRQRLDDEIKLKREQIEQLETALAKLKNVQKALG